MWYTKFDLKKRDTDISCPNCDNKFEEEIFYSLDENDCPSCCSKLIFIRSVNYIYVFDIKKSNYLFKSLYNEMNKHSLKESYLMLFEIVKVFEGNL
jgi:hypothetical protein